SSQTPPMQSQTQTMPPLPWKPANEAESLCDSIHATPDDKGKLPPDLEAVSWRSAKSIIARMENKGTTFLCEDDTVYAKSGENLIPLDEGFRVRQLLLCEGHSFNTAMGRVTLGWVQDQARARAQKTKFHRFCANVNGTILIPVQKGILAVSANGISDKVPEGTIVFPAHEQTPFQYLENVTGAFAEFEKLVVGTTATRITELGWLIAMNEGVFPFLAREYPVRALTIHGGTTSNGKSSGAETFSILHGFEKLTADVSMAALNTKRSAGIIFLDNKETKNISRDLEDWFIFSCTGGGRERCLQNGKLRHQSSERPLVVMTSIEGLSLPELRNRSFEIEFALSDEQKRMFGLKDHQAAVKKERNAIMSALMHVLAEFKRREAEYTKTEVPLNCRFGDHYLALCGLLRAYETCSNKPAKWADEIISVWHSNLSDHETQNEDLDHVITRFVRAGNRGEGATVLSKNGWKLIVLPATGDFLEWAMRNGLEKMLPTTALISLSKRLAECQTDFVKVIRWSDPWPQGEDIPEAWPEATKLLKKKSFDRPIGFLHRIEPTAKLDD